MNKIIPLLFVFISTVHLSFSQNILITDPDFIQGVNPLDCNAYSDGSVTNFFDGGNSTGTYSNNSNDTITICPDLALGSKVAVAFGVNAGFAWSVDSTDTLKVFDGPNTSSPLIGAFNSNSHPNGFNAQASFANNPTGCLTLAFIADAADSADGWLANVTCGNPYQPFEAHLEAFKNGDTTIALTPADTGYLDVCLGDSVLLLATPNFPYSSDITGTGYSQNMSNVTIEWEFSDGTSQTGDSVWFTPPARQGYLVTLKVTDNFPSSEYPIAKIRVSTQPIFSGIIVENDSICIGDTTTIVGGVTPSDTVGVDLTSSNFQLGGTFAGLTYLPDGSGVNYSTSVNITGFTPGDTISNASDIQQMCVTMEHSYIGDLEVWLECPNGTSVAIFDAYNGFGEALSGGFSGGGTYMGDALDDNIGNPGNGWEYCFSTTNATFGNIQTAGTVNAPLSNGNAIDPNGIYQPDQSFANFIGCPINGSWTLYVRDNQNIDDGYIFEWGVFFDPAINPNNENYSTVIVNDFWSSTSANIIDSVANDTIINIVGQNQGTDYFTYTVEDDFGCFYDTTVSVVINPQPVVQMTVYGNPTTCPGDSVNISTIGSSAIPPYNYSWSTGVSGATTTAIAAYPVTDSLFIVTLTDWCNTQTIDTAFITVPISLMSSTTVFDSVLCPGTNVLIDIGLTGGSSPYNYNWSTGDNTSTLTEAPLSSSSYIVTVTDQCNKVLIDTGSVYVPSFNPINLTTLIDGNVTCPGTGLIFTTSVTDGAIHVPYTYSWSHNNLLTDTFDILTINSDTVVVVTVTDGCGNSDVGSFTFNLPIYNDVIVSALSEEFVICENDTVEDDMTISGGTGTYVMSWSGSGYISSPNESKSLLSPTDQLGYDFIATDECGLSDTVHVSIIFEDCSVIAPLIFTPNGDAYNQVLHFTNLEKWPYNNLVIYDRWGRKIYEGNYQNDWNGDGHSDGVYYYILTLAAEEDPLSGYFHIAR